MQVNDSKNTERMLHGLENALARLVERMAALRRRAEQRVGKQNPLKDNPFVQAERDRKNVVLQSGTRAKEQQQTLEEERRVKAEAKAAQPIFRRSGKLVMKRSHIKSRRVAKRAGPEKDEDEEDRARFLS